MIAVNIVDEAFEIGRLPIFSNGKLLTDQHVAFHGGDADLSVFAEAGSHHIHDVVTVNADIEVGRFSLGIRIICDLRTAGEIDHVTGISDHHRTVSRTGVFGDAAAGHVKRPSEVEGGRAGSAVAGDGNSVSHVHSAFGINRTASASGSGIAQRCSGVQIQGSRAVHQAAVAACRKIRAIAIEADVLQRQCSCVFEHAVAGPAAGNHSKASFTVILRGLEGEHRIPCRGGSDGYTFPFPNFDHIGCRNGIILQQVDGPGGGEPGRILTDMLQRPAQGLKRCLFSIVIHHLADDVQGVGVGEGIIAVCAVRVGSPVICLFSGDGRSCINSKLVVIGLGDSRIGARREGQGDGSSLCRLNIRIRRLKGKGHFTVPIRDQIVVRVCGVCIHLPVADGIGVVLLPLQLQVEFKVFIQRRLPGIVLQGSFRYRQVHGLRRDLIPDRDGAGRFIHHIELVAEGRNGFEDIVIITIAQIILFVQILDGYAPIIRRSPETQVFTHLHASVYKAGHVRVRDVIVRCWIHKRCR